MRRCRYAVLLLLTLAACGAPRDDSVEAVVDVVDGVERLTYPEAGVARLGWRLDTLGVVGGAGALREEEQFNDVAEAGLAGDAAGSLYLLDPQGKRVLVFGPDGRFQATFGREGGGPGELGRPNGLALGPGDTVWLSDPANRRTTLFAPDGAFARSIPFPEGSQAPSGALAVTDGGFTQALLT
ncbi:MAG TPA: hypothetical protein VMK65_06805, partial [Longimicrobiales bacterium]|nr:hypothetical protein [Longimicrobiales bacterium]